MAEAQPLPKVSIVTVCFNSAATIRDSMESVLAQEYPHLEYIVVDGGSTDETAQIVRSFGSRVAAFVSERDRGIYDAMNKGIRMATGDVVGTLNSDDVYADTRAVLDLMTALRDANADAVFGDVVYVDRDDVHKVRRYYNSGRWRPRQFRFGWMPAHPTFFIKRDWFLRLGLYSLDYRIAADFEMLVRLLYRGKASYVHVPRPLIKMRMGGISTRGPRQSWMLNREIVKACRSNGIWTALPLVLLKIPFKLLELIHPGRPR